MPINYSIIIPHKNIPHLLKRCLDSIPQRDDLQIIIVDDNSSDSIVDFNNFPGSDRNNTEIIFSKEGKGAGYARNVGLEKVVGKWLIFADADDFFNYCFNDVLNEYIDCKSDMVYFGFNRVNSDDYQGISGGKSYNGFLINNHKAYSKDKFDMKIDGWIWAIMINAEVIKKYKLKFDEVPKNDDVMFACMLKIFIQDHIFDKRAIYCHTYRKNSIMNAPSDYNIMLSQIYVLGRCTLFLRNHNYKNWNNRFPCSILYYLHSKSKLNYQKAHAILTDAGFSRKEILLYERIYSKNRFKRKCKKILKNILPPILYKFLKLCKTTFLK